MSLKFSGITFTPIKANPRAKAGKKKEIGLKTIQSLLQGCWLVDSIYKYHIKLNRTAVFLFFPLTHFSNSWKEIPRRTFFVFTSIYDDIFVKFTSSAFFSGCDYTIYLGLFVEYLLSCHNLNLNQVMFRRLFPWHENRYYPKTNRLLGIPYYRNHPMNLP